MSRLCANITTDQIDDFFTIGKDVKINTVPRSRLGGKNLDPRTGKAASYTEKQFVPTYKRHARLNNPNQMAYAEYYKEKENEELMRATTEDPDIPDDDTLSTTTADFGRIESLSMTTAMTDSTLAALPKGVTEEEANQVYSNYNFRPNYDTNMATYKHREEIINIVESNQVTVIQGHTGSGKTTQIPQYILDDYAAKNRYCNIVVTQPRRIAAMSIARRVCDERKWPIGRVCAYQVGMDTTVSEDTRLLYCTTGVLVNKLISQKNMQQYTHVIMDEVHERDQESDFCLLVVKDFLKNNSRDVKVILMSATIDCSLFANYFKVQVRNQLQPAPVYEVEGYSFAVQKYFLDDIKKLGDIPVQDPSSPNIDPTLNELVKSLIMHFDIMEIQQFKKEVNGLSTKRGSVLIFLPGLGEIQDLHQVLQTVSAKYQLWLLPLHSTITGEEQSEVFEKPAPGFRKVILSTNIAESSITVPDIKYVIDYCLTKTVIADPESTYTSLVLEWASDANCKQRQGRAGRVSDGRVYRLVTRRFYEEYIPDYGTPEMQRCPLDSVILKTKRLDRKEPKAFLGLALSPPRLDDIECTILSLKEVGALTSPSEGANPHDGDLTFLGRVLADLPLDIRLGKLILLGHVFGTLEECIIISASLSNKSFFVSKFQSYLVAYRKKMDWADDSFSDCIAYLNAYRMWQHMKDSGRFANSRLERQWAKESGIQLRRIKDVADLVQDLQKRLLRLNIRTPHMSRKEQKDHEQFRNSSEYQLILKVVLCGAFYPNFFTMGQLNEEEAHRELSGHNPHNTVMMRGFPANQGKLYKKQVEELFLRCDERGQRPNIHFEETKAFIEFVRDPTQSLSGTKILPAVYMALKMKQLQLPMDITTVNPELVRQQMEQLSLQQSSLSRQTKALRSNRFLDEVELQEQEESQNDPQMVPLPQADKNYISLCPTITGNVSECGSFWAQYQDADTVKKLNNLQENINGYGGHRLQPLPPSQRMIGSLCLAPYVDEDDPGGIPQYYRGRIEKLANQNQIAFVFFVDYGNISEVPYHQLKELDKHFRKLPLQAFHCKLCHITPSAIKCPNGRWTKEANMMFRDLLRRSDEAYAQVYSIVHGVVRLDLYLEVGRAAPIHVNKKLVDDCYADLAEEDFLSNQNHRQREENSMSSLSRSNHVLRNKVDDDLPNLDNTGLGGITTSGTNSFVRKRGLKIRLTGPTSPYENNYSNMTCVGRLRSCRVERDSVNSVSLDDEPHIKYSRMMVSAAVGLTPNGSTMKARDTTLMPSIPGLPAIIALLFAPVAELRRDPEKKYFTGVICGLGCNDDGTPVMSDHDMEIAFDTPFDIDDMKSVNAVRMAINMAISTRDGSESVEWAPEMMLQLHEQIRERIMKLFKKRRPVIEPRMFSRPYHWQQYEPDELLTVRVENNLVMSNLLALHNCLRTYHSDSEEEEEEEEGIGSPGGRENGLDARSVATGYSRISSAVSRNSGEARSLPRVPTMTEVIQEQKKHIQELRQLANRTTQPRVVTCQLCNFTVRTSRDLMIHLQTRKHRTNEATVMNQRV